MNMKKASNVCDYFVITSGASTTQVRAIADNIEIRLKELGEHVHHVEGLNEAVWVVIDSGDVVCHVFLAETRSRYGLEKLWVKAPKERFKEKALRKKRKKHISKPKRRRKIAKKY